jgi:hypothetical protein
MGQLILFISIWAIPSQVFTLYLLTWMMSLSKLIVHLVHMTDHLHELGMLKQCKLRIAYYI